MQHIYPTHAAHVFHLSLVAFCERMYTAQATLSVSATVPPSAPVATLTKGEDMVAELSFAQGRITRCQLSLRTSGRVLLQQGEAFQALNTAGVLPWRMHPQEHDAEAETTLLSAIASSRNNTELPARVPLHAVPVEHVSLTSLPIRVRHVFLLSNGQRTLEDIAHVLRLPLEEVERVIQILQKRKLTIWQSRAS